MSYRRDNLFSFGINRLRSPFPNAKYCFSYREILSQRSILIFCDAKGRFRHQGQRAVPVLHHLRLRHSAVRPLQRP
jgi:hypothetical protein